MKKHEIVSESDWLTARKELLEEEKDFTRLRDQMSARQRALPWMRVKKDYRFRGSDGEVGLTDLFEGRSQLLLYHFMFHPDWDAACKSCSFWADGYNGYFRHLAQRDVSLSVVSRAPVSKLADFAAHAGWEFPWYSSRDSEFNYDFKVSFTEQDIATGSVHYNFRDSQYTPQEAPGLSVFYRDSDNQVFRTYSCYARGLDMLNGAYHHLDLVPKGRDEQDLPFSMAWLNHQMNYD